jgi:FkbM family methyltransferase
LPLHLQRISTIERYIFAERILSEATKMSGEKSPIEIAGRLPKSSWAAKEVMTRHSGKRPFYYRPGTSDESVIRQILLQLDYDVSRLSRAADLHAAYNRILATGHVPLIIDAGANIGASTLYLADSWAEARVIAIEPDGANLELLCSNTSGLPQVTCLRAALAARSGEMLLVDPGQGHWGLRALPTDKVLGGAIVRERIPALGMQDLLQQYSSPCSPFLCKIDIEGGEQDLFSDITGWIDSFPLLVIELHDWLLPGQSTSHHFLREIAMRNRDFVYRGENIFSIANRLNGVTMVGSEAAAWVSGRACSRAAMNSTYLDKAAPLATDVATAVRGLPVAALRTRTRTTGLPL